MQFNMMSIVTTFAVVWIEMHLSCCPALSPLSPPSRWCGLKLDWWMPLIILRCHHLRGGVDWNSTPSWLLSPPSLSPPSRWCGLKFCGCLTPVTLNPVTTFAVVWIEIVIWDDPQRRDGSPPSRWCGLKYDWTFPLMYLLLVTTFAVVWIEILNWERSSRLRWGHHLRGGVDWNIICPVLPDICGCHHLRSGVDWNLTKIAYTEYYQSHHLRGGVDWNHALRGIL